jgi:Phytanoyl-CoA dioxygenase (PhyH)
MIDVDEALNHSIVTALQLHTQPPLAHRVAEIVSGAVNGVLNEQPPQRTPLAEQVAADGYVPLGQVLSASECAAIRDHFKGCVCVDSHTAPYDDGDLLGLRRAKIGEGAEGFHLASYETRDIVDAPALWELANRPELLSLAGAYLGCRPTLYSLNAWWSFPQPTKAPVTHNYHRDFDDFKFCTLFVYLTDVDLRSGPHRFIKQSHRFERISELVKQAAPRLGTTISALPPQMFYGNRWSDESDRLYESVFEGLVDTIEGPAGFAFLADTSALHKGVLPVSSPRLMFWARYGLRINHTARPPVPAPARLRSRLADPVTAYINRCIIRAP